MEDRLHIWDKRGVEIPPGWHSAMHKLSELTGVGLKYLYAVALDRLLSDENLVGIEEDASVLQRRSRKDLKAVCEQHTPERVEDRHRQPSGVRKARRGRRNKG